MGSADLWLLTGLLLMGGAVYLFVSTFMGDEDQRKMLSWATDDEPEKSKSGFVELSRPLVHKFCLPLTQKVKSPRYRKKIDKLIKTAGLQRVLNLEEFIGMQILWGVLVPIVVLLMNFAFELGYPIWVIAGVSLVGAYFPYMHVNGEKKNRYNQIIVDFPFFIDILALATKNLDFMQALQRVVDRSGETVLGQEFAQVIKDLTLGRSREDALRDMAKRLDIREINSFVAIIIDSEKTGAPISDVLQAQSEQMRVERFTKAEKAGARASQAILLPLVLFILPAVFIVVMGPVILTFINSGEF